MLWTLITSAIRLMTNLWSVALCKQTRCVTSRQMRPLRDIERRWRCAYLVREVAVGAGEVCGTPARDGHLAQPLFRGDAQREDAEHHDGVAATKTVDKAVASSHAGVVLPHPDRHGNSLHDCSPLFTSLSNMCIQATVILRPCFESQISKCVLILPV